MKKNILSFIKNSSLILILSCLTLSINSCSKSDNDKDEFQKITVPESVEPHTFRFIDYNILEGMKLDKENNFENFVKWVETQKPDIMALCECNNFTQESLTELAKRYGHPYVVLCKETGYPVALTSKYPIELRNRMLKDAPLWHGALHLKVKDLNIVVLHLYPFGAYPRNGVANSGNEYRDNEINYILDNTIRKYPQEPNWIMCGDFNSFSDRDAENMGGGTYFGTHNIVRNSGYYDVLSDRHSSFQYTIPTVYADQNGDGYKRRIDFIYMSKTLAREVVEAKVIYDDFTNSKSDHYPILVDFRMYK